MFVYGIRCNSAIVVTLPNTTDADYYMEHELLVFPSYSRPSCVRNHGPMLTKHFLADLKRIVERPDTVHELDLEEPFLEEEEDALVRRVRSVLPGSAPAWYHIP